MEYFSQFGQDKFIDEHVTRGRKGGKFVEIGAYDGVTFSNCLALEKYRNWTGICIEPLPASFELLQKNRAAKCFQCCIGDKPGTVEFNVVEGIDGGGMLSALKEAVSKDHADRISREQGTVRTIQVEMVTFEAVMARAALGPIDYISIDTEGHEFAILKTIDLQTFQPSCLTIEENGRYLAIKRHVGKWGYRVAEKLGADLMVVSGPVAKQMKGVGLLNPVNRMKRYSAAAMRRIGIRR